MLVVVLTVVSPVWFTFRYRVLVTGRRSVHAESISLLGTVVSLYVSPCLQQHKLFVMEVLNHLYPYCPNGGLVWQSYGLGWLRLNKGVELQMILFIS